MRVERRRAPAGSYFFTERGAPREALSTRGYWRLGSANHSDRDYGAD